MRVSQGEDNGTATGVKPKRKFALLRKQKDTHITMINQFLQEEEGQTLVEYGLLISLIALVVIGVLTLLGAKIKNTFNTSANAMNTTT